MLPLDARHSASRGAQLCLHSLPHGQKTQLEPGTQGETPGTSYAYLVLANSDVAAIRQDVQGVPQAGRVAQELSRQRRDPVSSVLGDSHAV